MSLVIVTETADKMEQASHHFTDVEREFILQFAFKSGSTELTNQLIDELVDSGEGEVEKILDKYGAMYGMRPAWVEQVENLLVSIEMYRLEEAKAISRLAEVLSVYGVEVSEEQVRKPDADEIRDKVREKQEQPDTGADDEGGYDRSEKEKGRFCGTTLRNVAI